jgi:hypothetical protein
MTPREVTRALSGVSAVHSYSGAPMLMMTYFSSLTRGRRIRLRRLMIGGVGRGARTALTIGVVDDR